MDEQTESGNTTLYALDAFARWLEAEPPQGKVRQVLMAFAAQTREALERGGEPPTADVNQLHALYRDQAGGPAANDPITGKWLPASQVRTWWEGQQNSRRQFLQGAKAQRDVDLIIDLGGGRGNPTTYRFAFPESASSQEQEDFRSTDGAPHTVKPSPDLITYSVEQAESALLWRPVIGKPFSMKSAKGVLFLVIVSLPLAVLIFCGIISAVWLATSSVNFLKHIGPFVLAVTISAIALRAFKPIWDLPTLRVTIAPDWLISTKQMYAQFRLTRDSEKKAGGRFSLVRFYASCPVCAGAIEVREGGTAFPGRLVGCCSDSPREHVFSFDAVTQRGRALLR
ncbi:hypothetical protein L2Y96_19200 [Luteibacter aegosomaticola]|uniref:hypothetical protein n=1 Tax=Luteibacter aegosomaticola TaxID=2911538 RepID=UPI001FF89096|nr:hypothetical protein [Luteibacter aegosomaticola]UPG89500.1 hypothetical protein L2Y96_19200 [Luteibacter aegosomaticola]